MKAFDTTIIDDYAIVSTEGKQLLDAFIFAIIYRNHHLEHSYS